MGIHVEFFSAHSQALVELFNLPIEDMDRFVISLQEYRSADFSFHLYIPEDLDRLCQSMRRYGSSVPPVFQDLLIKQLWFDNNADSLTLLDTNFALAWKDIDDQRLEHIAVDWSTEFHYQEPLHHTPAYKALLELRDVATDVFCRNTSLVFYLSGAFL